MKNISSIDSEDTPVRTQITLTKRVKEIVEQSARKQNESLAEYLRKAALMRWLVERNDAEDRKQLAKNLVGSIDMKTHPVWRSKNDVQTWLRNIREEQ